MDDFVDPTINRIAATMDAELRAEQAEYEALAVQTEQRRQTISSAVAQWAVQGWTVQFHVHSQIIIGTVTVVGTDYATVRSQHRTFDALLACCHSIERGKRNNGHEPVKIHGHSFRARLSEHEGVNSLIVVGLDGGTDFLGHVQAVAKDHLVLTNRHGDRLVPLTQIQWCSTEAPSPAR